MNQIGPVLKEARKKADISIEDASRETKIAKKYLIAIENENFEIFPGETYLIGFLRNYAQFLGLDSDEIILKYKDFKIQEHPAPIEQLIARPKSGKKVVLVSIIIVIAISVALYVYLNRKKGDRPLTRIMKEKDKEKTSEQTKGPPVQAKEDIIVFEEEELIRNFEKDDVIVFFQKNKKYTISIDSINENLGFSIGEIPFSLSTGERVEIDFDRDGRKDVLMRANRLGEGSVNLTLKKLYKSELKETEIAAAGDEGPAEGPARPPEVVIIKEDDILSNIPVAPKTGFSIVSSYEKTTINTLVKANSTAYFAYVIDEKDKEDVLLKKSEEINIVAKEALRLMAANAKGIDLEINNIPITLGRGGEVIAKVVRWYRDAENNDLYHLIIDDLEK
jgi:cytoskeleton protein RodZ